MKKLLGILVLGLLLIGNANATSKNIKVLYSSSDWIRIQIKGGFFFGMSSEKSVAYLREAAEIAVNHCENLNKHFFMFSSQKDGQKIYESENKIGKGIVNFYCANSLNDALYLQKTSGLPTHSDWMGTVWVISTLYPDSEKKVEDILNEQRRKKEIELARKKAEEKKRQEYQKELQRKVEEYEQKRLAEANKKNNQSNFNSSGREKAKQVMSFKSETAMKGFVGGLIGMAFGFGLYSIMDRKIKKKINDKFFFGAAFFIGWILTKFI